MKFDHSEQRAVFKRCANQWLCIFFISVLTGCATHSAEKWSFYDAGPFSFSMPLSLATDTSRPGIDSYVRVFTNTDMVLNFDYGAYSGYPLDEITNKPQYNSHIETIAGHKVQIASFDGDMHFPEHFNYNIIVGFLGAGLTMQVACKTDSDFNDATIIFRSVRFKKGEIKWQ